MLLLPVTVAVNCCVPPAGNEAEAGLMLTETTGGGGAAWAELAPVAPHPALAIASANANSNNS